jgi:hypothetical protein
MFMSCKKYRPSNGTEGEGFMGCFCYQCIHDNGDDKLCEIISLTMCLDVNDKDYPEEWTYDEQNNPTCTKFVKWDWGKDDDGNWIQPSPPPIDDPNQLCLPFIFDELGINITTTKTTNYECKGSNITSPS